MLLVPSKDPASSCLLLRISYVKIRKILPKDSLFICLKPNKKLFLICWDLNCRRHTNCMHSSSSLTFCALGLMLCTYVIHIVVVVVCLFNRKKRLSNRNSFTKRVKN